MTERERSRRAGGQRAEVASERTCRLHTVSEQKKGAQEAPRYHALVQSWPEIARLAQAGGQPQPRQAEPLPQPPE